MQHRPQSHVFVISVLAVLFALGGCGSVYHEIARREPGGLGQRLELRRAEAIALHDQTIDTIDRIVADLREERRTRTRAGRAERMGFERIDAEQLAWRARKSIASIEDVIVLDADGSIDSSAADGAARQMTALEQASDEIDSAIELARKAVERYEAGEIGSSDLLAHLDERLARARELVDHVR